MIEPSAEITYTTQTFDLNEAITGQSFDFKVNFENIEEDAGKCYLMINESGGMVSIYQAEIDELDEGENNIHVSYSDIFENYTPTSGSEYAVEIVAYVEQGTNLDSANGNLEIVDTTLSIEITAEDANISLDDPEQKYTFEASIENLNENAMIVYSVDDGGIHITDGGFDANDLSDGNNQYDIDLTTIVSFRNPSSGDTWTITLTPREGLSQIGESSIVVVTFTSDLSPDIP